MKNTIPLLCLILTLTPEISFTEVADTGDIGDDFSYNFGVSWGDFDGDGNIELFFANGLQQGNSLFRNTGNGQFSLMTEADIGELANDTGDSGIGLWVDMDNDGDLDIYVANYSEALNEEDWLDNSIPAQADRLYLNDGSGFLLKRPLKELTIVRFTTPVLAWLIMTVTACSTFSFLLCLSITRSLDRMLFFTTKVVLHSVR